MGNGKNNGNGDLHILVVEDNEDLAALLMEQLRYHGCHVTTVTSDFDQLIDSDIWVGINGAVVDMWLTNTGFNVEFPVAFQLLQFLARKYPNIVRVVYSAVPQQYLVYEGVGVQQLAHYVFTKPLQTEELVEALRG